MASNPSRVPSSPHPTLLTNRRKTADLPVTDTTGMSYATCLEEELARNMKRAPLAFYPVLPTTLLEPAALALPRMRLVRRACSFRSADKARTRLVRRCPLRSG